MGFAGHSEKKYLEDPYIYSVIPRPVDPLSPSWPRSSSSFPLFASVRILRSAWVRKRRQKATKRTKNRKTSALPSLKNSVVRPEREALPDSHSRDGKLGREG